MKIKILEKPRVIMDSTDRLFNYFGWPTATRLKNGEIADKNIGALPLEAMEDFIDKNL